MMPIAHTYKWMHEIVQLFNKITIFRLIEHQMEFCLVNRKTVITIQIRFEINVERIHKLNSR